MLALPALISSPRLIQEPGPPLSCYTEFEIHSGQRWLKKFVSLKYDDRLNSSAHHGFEASPKIRLPTILEELGAAKGDGAGTDEHSRLQAPSSQHPIARGRRTLRTATIAVNRQLAHSRLDVGRGRTGFRYSLVGPFWELHGRDELVELFHRSRGGVLKVYKDTLGFPGLLDLGMLL